MNLFHCKPALFLFFACSIYLGAIVAAGLSAKPAASDLAVVLGNEVLANGKPSARLQARLDCALALYQKHLTTKILVSGGKGKSGFDEATVMKDYLVGKNVPAADILIDSLGVNSMATAMNTAALQRTMGFKRVIVVTQYYHIPRCLFAFRKAGIKQLSADYPRYFEIGDLFAIVREGAAIPVYFIKMSDKE